jgi:hypothetical protein
MTEAEKVHAEAVKGCQQELALVRYYQAKVGAVRAWDVWLKVSVGVFPLFLALAVRWPVVLMILFLVQMLTYILLVSICSTQRIVDLHSTLENHLRLQGDFERICRKDPSSLTREELELVVGRASAADRWEGLDAPRPDDAVFHKMLEEVRENYKVPGD